MRRRSAAIRLLILLLALGVTVPGCWDRIEINELAIVTSAAFDDSPEAYEAMLEIFRPSSAASSAQLGGAGTPQGLRNVTLIMGGGSSPLSAVRDCMSKCARRIYPSQMVAAIVGEKLAERDIRALLDIWEREEDFRSTAYFLISKGAAGDVLAFVGAQLERTAGGRIAGLANTVELKSFSLVTTVHDVLVELSSEGRRAVVGVVEIVPSADPPMPRSPMPWEEDAVLQPQNTASIEMTGIAVLKENKAVAFLPSSEITRAIVIAQGKAGGMSLDIPGEGGAGCVSTLDVFHITPKIKVDTEGGISLSIKVKLKANLSTYCLDTPLTASMLIELEKRAEDEMIRQMKDSINALQEIPLDAFGFCGALYRADPKMWSEVKDHWDEVFGELDIEVEAEVGIDHIGLTSGSAWSPLK